MSSRPTGHALVVGESLIDLIQARGSGEAIYAAKVGGAPLNVAVGITRLGEAATLLTALTDDALADQITNMLADERVGVAAIQRPAASATPIAIVTHSDDGHRYSFYGRPFDGFDRPELSLPRSLALDYDVVHLGSSLLLEGNAYRLLEQVAGYGKIRTLDPNYRPTLVADKALYRSRVDSLLSQIDLVKLSDDDCLGAYGYSPEAFAAHAHALGAPLVLITRGSAPVLLSRMGEVDEVPAVPTRVVDPTGAGDSFMAAVITQLLRRELPATLAETRAIVEFAVRAASITTAGRGGAESMPTARQLEEKTDVPDIPG